jgi:hypothetical protein
MSESASDGAAACRAVHIASRRQLSSNVLSAVQPHMFGIAVISSSELRQKLRAPTAEIASVVLMSSVVVGPTDVPTHFMAA